MVGPRDVQGDGRAASAWSWRTAGWFEVSGSEVIAHRVAVGSTPNNSGGVQPEDLAFDGVGEGGVAVALLVVAPSLKRPQRHDLWLR